MRVCFGRWELALTEDPSWASVGELARKQSRGHPQLRDSASRRPKEQKNKTYLRMTLPGVALAILAVGAMQSPVAELIGAKEEREVGRGRDGEDQGPPRLGSVYVSSNE